MNTKTISKRALSVIDQYQNFKIGSAVCSVPYFNNQRVLARMTVRAEIGKGSPQDIFEETRSELVKNHVSLDLLTSDILKKFMTDANIGIDCSGFAYYVLNAESQELNKGSLDRHIDFVNCRGLFRKIQAKMRPAENCDVATFADQANSLVVEIGKANPGDVITMLGGPDSDDRNHILVVHQVEYQNFNTTKIHYSHAIAYPEDGIYGTGVKQGEIEIVDPEGSIVESKWTEYGLHGESNRIFNRALKSKTELRRLRIFEN